MKRSSFLALALGFFVALAISCGAPAKKCDLSNCAQGCCDAEGTCQLGSSTAACGNDGMMCAACSLGQTCQLGFCVNNFGGGNGGAGGGSNGGGGGSNVGGGNGGGSGVGGGNGGGGSSVGGGNGGGSSVGGGNGGGSSVGGGGGSSTGGGGGGFGGGNGGGSSTGGGGGGFGGGGGGGGGSSTGGGGGGSSTGGGGGGFGGGFGGGGGSSTGGGGGSSVGGGTGTCQQMTSFGPTATVAGVFMDTKYGIDVVEGRETRPATSGQDLLLFDFWVGANAVVGSGALPGTTWASCIYCVTLFNDCSSLTTNYGGTAPTTCTEGYLAQGGSYSITTLDGADGGSGSVVGSVSNVQFQQWDFTADTAVVGGKCITLSSGSINASW